MCGIVGIVDFDRVQARVPWTDDTLADVTTLRDGLTHRGPDSAGLWDAPGVVLGHRRLAIVDLSPGGHQPMVGVDGGVITFNGEIYNYIELKRELGGYTFRSSSDTEVLLAAFGTWGVPETMQRARGMAAFGYWQPSQRTLWLGRDAIGKKPLFVWRHGPRLAFASELWPLVQWLHRAGVSLDVDPVAIEHFLAAGYIPAPRTVFAQIRKLQAGEILRCDATGNHPQAIRPVPFARDPRPLDARAVADLDALLEQAVVRRLRADVPVATFLSGGLDSTLVTAVAAQLHPGLTAYTVRTGDGNEDELEIARRVAQRTGVRHEILDLGPGDLSVLPELVRHYGEPFGDSSALPTWRVSEAAGRHHRVVLTGDGGDEVQGGYPRSQLFALRHWVHDRLHVPEVPHLREHLGLPRQTGAQGRVEDAIFRAFRVLSPGAQAAAAQRDQLTHLHHLFAPDLAPTLESHGWQSLVRSRFAALPAASELDRALGLEFTLYLPEDLNMKVDVASMAHAVETRAPLLDLDFTDASWQIRPQDRVRPRQTKRIIRALLAKRLPADCVLPGKRGFAAPVGQWLGTKSMRGTLESRLRAGLPGLPWLDGPAAADELNRRYASGAEVGALAWRLLWLTEWGQLLTTLRTHAHR